MENNQRVIGTLPLNIPNQRARVQKFVLDGDRVRVEIDQETSSLVDKLSADLTTQPFLSKILRDLELRGLRYDAELAAEGSAWEVAAEPEPQYFETLCEAIDFRDSLIDIEPRQK